MKNDELAPRVVFEIVGDGPVLRRLRDNAPENILLRGRLSKQDTVKALLKADIAIFTQKNLKRADLNKQALPNKYIDYLGTSLPMVVGASKDGEMAEEIIDCQCGIVVEPEDVSALYDAVRGLVKSEDVRKMMAAASGELGKKYSYRNHVYRFVSVIEGVKNDYRL